VGVCSYLLVHFWYTRVAAVKSAMNAMFTNRVGDYFLTIGFFAIFFTFGTLDYATVFSLAPYINVNVITFIAILLLLGAAAKSAQLGLHVWLPQAMEGELVFNNFQLKFSNSTTSHRSHEKTLKYSTINKPDILYDAIIGDLLGDGHLRFHGKNNNKNNQRSNSSNARMEFTFSRPNLPYLRYLKFVAYGEICTISEPTPWPNPQTGKPITQYWFSTRSLPLFTKLYKEWYKEIDGKYVKIIPLNIKELLKPVGLAHWIMGDGYLSGKAVCICTDNFSFEEVNLLANVINENFNIAAKISNRISSSGMKCWRIRIGASSTQKLRDIIIPYMIPEMLYKINVE